MSPARIDWRTSVRLRYCVRVFYDAERVLSAIAKFTCCLFTSSGKRRGEMKFEKGECHV